MRCVLPFAVATLTLAAAASADTLTLSSDTAFQALEASGGFTKQFGGNVRWGSGTANGDWEYAIVDSSDSPIGAVAQTPWSGTNIHSFTFTYDPAGTTTLTLDGIGSITRTVVGAPTVLFARVRDSVTPFSALGEISVDLALPSATDYSFSLLTGDANAEYWGVRDSNLQFGFTITGQASLAGPRSSGSDPMYQFKLGVPTPGAAAVFALAGLVAARRRR